MNDPDSSPVDRLNQMLAYNLTQMLFVVVKLRIPDILAGGPKSAAEIARSVGAHPPSLYRLLRALASLGVFLEDHESRFGLTPLSSLLRSDVPDSFRPFALSYGEPWWWNAWGSLLHSVQTGETAFNFVHGKGLFEYFNQNPDAARIFNANMTSMTDREAQSVVTAFDFSSTRVLVDVGGGHGALVSAILQAYPQVHAKVFDLPSVIEGTRAHLDSVGLTARCELIGGNFFESIPVGGDTYTLKDIVHDWDDEQAVAILRNCRAAMSSSARLLIIERLIPPGNEPSSAKLIDISMLVFSGGRERTEAEYRTLLEAGGFTIKNIHPTDFEINIIEAYPV